MENPDLEKMWKEYDQKLEQVKILNLQAWVVSMQTFEHLQLQKAKARLHPLAHFKRGAVLLGVVWVAFLGLLVYGNALKNLFFTASLGMLMAFSILAIAVYIRHIHL